MKEKRPSIEANCLESGRSGEIWTLDCRPRAFLPQTDSHQSPVTSVPRTCHHPPIGPTDVTAKCGHSSSSSSSSPLHLSTRRCTSPARSTVSNHCSHAAPSIPRKLHSTARDQHSCPNNSRSPCSSLLTRLSPAHRFLSSSPLNYNPIPFIPSLFDPRQTRLVTPPTIPIFYSAVQSDSSARSNVLSSRPLRATISETTDCRIDTSCLSR